MNFGLAGEVSVEIMNKDIEIYSFSKKLEDYFINKGYGADIKSLTIGIVCMSPRFYEFYTDRKPKYTKAIKTKIRDGISLITEDSLEYDIKVDYETFKNADKEGLEKLLEREILASLVVFENVKSKIKNFNLAIFKADLEGFFKSHKLI